MSAPVVLDWLNEQSLRAYPLKEKLNRVANTDYVLLDTVIIDATFIYTTLTLPVTLNTIVVSGGNVTFNLSNSLSFTVPQSGPFPYYKRLSNGSLMVVGVDTANIPTGTHTFTDLEFEPVVCYESGGDWLGVSSVAFNSSSPLTGTINLIEGFQFGIDITKQIINLEVGRNYGNPISCKDFSGDSDDCNTIISYIDGISPDLTHTITFNPGNGIVILNDPDNNRLFIGLTFLESDICQTIQTNPAL